VLISIVTPSFGQLDWLRLCVASIADQARSSRGALAVEHIVQDAGTKGIEEFARSLGAEPGNGSTGAEQGDGSADAPSPSRPTEGYRLEVHAEADHGMYDAVNRGLGRAHGELCAYLNCDEQYLPGVLSKVAAHFAEHPRLEVLFAGAIVVDPAGRYLCDRVPTLPTRAHTLVSGNLSFFTSSTFFRASVVRERGLWFDPSWRALGDSVWALRLIEAGVRMEAVAWPASTHTDTGHNLALSEGARVERGRLAESAAPWVRAAKPLIVAAHRMSKLAHGAYQPKAHCYRIYTHDSPHERTGLTVDAPTWRWR
jgi:glycosyltransferase involved in cell wall biosynthesis